MLEFRELPEQPGDKQIREGYLDAMEPLFFPKTPHVPDIVQYVCALLRAGGMEDADWDPFIESKGVIFDLFRLMKINFTEEHFEKPDLTTWRLGLLFYSQIVEASAPYDVLMNLLRYRLDRGFSMRPFNDFLRKSELKQSKKSGIFPHQKIRILTSLGEEAGLPFGAMFDGFYRRNLRNAIAHGDFIFSENGIRVRGIDYFGSFEISFEELDLIINHSKIFFHVFYSLLEQARGVFGGLANRFWGYDPHYKGIFEFLASSKGMLEGFKVHWPNGSDSYYRRSEAGNECVNCLPKSEPPGLELFVGLYARKRDAFSPLVEHGLEPIYTPIEKTGDVPFWRDS